jgi:hypothetical protein
MITKEKVATGEQLKVVVEALYLVKDLLEFSICGDEHAESLASLTVRLLDLVAFSVTLQQAKALVESRSQASQIQELLNQINEMTLQLVKSAFLLAVQHSSDDVDAEGLPGAKLRTSLLSKIFQMHSNSQLCLARDKAKDLCFNLALDLEDDDADTKSKGKPMTQLKLVMAAFDEISEQHPKKLEITAKLISCLLSKILKCEEGSLYKHKETMGCVFDFVLAILSKLHHKDQFDESQMSDSLVDDNKSDTSAERSSC